MCAYCPVRKVARDGQQTGRFTKLFTNVAPCAPIRWRVFGKTRIDSDGLIVSHHHDNVRQRTLGASTLAYEREPDASDQDRRQRPTELRQSRV